MEAIMNVEFHHTTKELQMLYRTEKIARLAQRIHGVYLASKGLTCPQIMNITGAAHDLGQRDRQNMNGYMLSVRFVHRQARALDCYRQRLTPI